MCAICTDEIRPAQLTVCPPRMGRLRSGQFLTGSRRPGRREAILILILRSTLARHNVRSGVSFIPQGIKEGPKRCWILTPRVISEVPSPLQFDNGLQARCCYHRPRRCRQRCHHQARYLPRRQCHEQRGCQSFPILCHLSVRGMLTSTVVLRLLPSPGRPADQSIRRRVRRGRP